MGTSWTNTPRDRYKDRYKPHPDGTDIIEMTGFEPGSPRERVYLALCDAWKANRFIKHGIVNIALGFSDEACESIVRALDDPDKSLGKHCLELASDSCGSLLIKIFVRTAQQQEPQSRDALFKLIKAVHQARKSGAPLTAQGLSSLSQRVQEYSSVSGASWENIMLDIPVITPIEALCIRFVNEHPSLATTVAERLSEGTDQQILGLLADHHSAIAGGTL